MRNVVDVAIIGGGLAGSTLAAVLAARGVSIALCDRHATYPGDFRAEKLSPPQMRMLERLGLGARVRAVATPIETLAIARRGRVVEQRPAAEYALDYRALVGVIRAAVPASAMRIGRVADIAPGEGGGRTVVLGDGRRIEARLVVLATGLGRGLLEKVGISRVAVCDGHCLAIGFDLATERGRGAALTYHGERLADRSAYLTLFPIGERLRANLFVYRTHVEDWAATFRHAPVATLHAMMPGLAPILGDLALIGPPVLRPIDLHATAGHERIDGIVVIGDAFATTCPTGGTGIDKVLTDVERLAAHVPRWLAAGDTRAASIARFYADPVKMSCDARARRMIAYARAMALDPGIVWAMRRHRNYWGLAVRDWLRRNLNVMGARSVSRLLAGEDSRGSAQPIDCNQTCGRRRRARWPAAARAAPAPGKAR